jgi:hypothetical protein
MKSAENAFEKERGLSFARALSNRVLLITLALFLIFSALYFTGSLALSQTPAFTENDVLFQLDTKRTVDDMTYFGGFHYRTKVHPIFVLLTEPAGEILVLATHNHILAAVILNSLFGAAGVVLIFVMFTRLFGSRRKAVLLAVLFGVTASQVLLSVIPGTSTLAVCSLLATMNLFAYSLCKKAMPVIPWILAGVFTLGVTTTNVAQTVICFAIGCLYVYRDQGLWIKVRKTSLFLAGVVGVTVILALVQKVIYPSSMLFFLPEAYTEDMQYASTLILHNPGIVLWQLFKNFFLVNIIAPQPVVFPMEGRSLPAVTFTPAMQFTSAGYAGLILWISLWLTGIAFAIKKYRKMPKTLTGNRVFLIGSALCLLFNLALHSVYGVGEHGAIEYFLYSANFTFLVIAIWGLVLDIPKRVMYILLTVLILCAAVANVQIFLQLIYIYAGAL